MGVSRKHINELCNDWRAVTADTALMLTRVFGNSADVWRNVQRTAFYASQQYRSAGTASSEQAPAPGHRL